MPKQASLSESLAKNYVIDSKSGCWIWTAGRRDRYGVVWDPKTKRQIGAHRAAYELHYGVSIGRFHCLHKCDTPLCINPTHLFAGTHLDNMRDRHQKGRTVMPTKRAVKITDYSVNRIRELFDLGHTTREIGYFYGISGSNVSLIVRGLSRSSA